MKTNNLTKKIISFAMAIVLLFGIVALSACKDDNGTTTNPQANTGTNVTAKNNGSYSKATQTDKVLVDNGNTTCKIVLPKNYDAYEQVASEELNYFVNQSLGVTFEVVTDDNISWSVNAPLISVGDTALTKQVGFVVNKQELGTSGYVIKTIGQTVFICGGTSVGSVFGVYEFLHYAIGYTFYNEQEINVDRLAKMYLFNYDVKTIPCFQYPYLASSLLAGEFLSNGSYANAIRYRITTPFVNTAGGTHNSLDLVDLFYDEAHGYVASDKTPLPQGDERWNWIAKDSSGTYVPQLNYTYDIQMDENGNFERDEQGNVKFAQGGMADTMVDNIINRYLAPAYANGVHEALTYFQIGIEDRWGWDAGEKSKILLQKYGTNSAAHVIFINYVARKLQAWLDEAYPGRKINVSFFAYQDTLDPPVKHDGDGNLLLDENGKAIPVDNDVVFEDNVIARLAPIDANWYESFGAESNKKTADQLLGWAGLGKMCLWLYSISFSTHYAQFNNFNSLQATYQWCYENLDVDFFEDQYLSTGKDNPCFCAYRAYMEMQLMWNVYADQEQLTKDFFDHYYKDVSGIMLTYLDELRAVYMDNWRKVGLKGDCNTVNLYIPELWTMGLLLKWQNYMQQAYQQIEHYKATDAKTYEQLCGRIEREELSIRFLLAYLYGETLYSASDLLAEKQAIYDGMKKYDMYYRNAHAFDELKSLLGI